MNHSCLFEFGLDIFKYLNTVEKWQVFTAGSNPVFRVIDKTFA